MHALRSHIALLLLCLARTLLPEEWILALHPHAHTTVEPAHAPTFARKSKTLPSAEHQHRDVEQFYNVAFQAALPVRVPGPWMWTPHATPAARRFHLLTVTCPTRGRVFARPAAGAALAL